jgi:hypothetical protein
MVRLLRLVSNDPNGFFNNDFNTDIKIEAGQQIALQSASFAANFSRLDIDGVNDNLRFDYTGALGVEIVLTHGTFSNMNFESLFSDMTDKLNRALVYQSGKTIGLTFLAQINPLSRKCEIGYIRSNIVSNNSRVVANGNLSAYQSMTFTGGTYRRVGGNGANDVCKYYSNVEWGAGCMIHRLRIVGYNDNGGGATENQGLILGLSNVPPAEWETSANMSAAQKTYYIKIHRDNTPYRYKVKGGAEVVTAINPEIVAGTTVSNDMIELVRNGENIQGILYRDSQPAGEVLFTEPYIQGEKLYPFITVQGGHNEIRFNRASHTINPYHTDHVQAQDETQTEEEAEAVTANPPPDVRGGTVATPNVLSMRESLAEFCGFENSVNNQFEIFPNFLGNRVFVGVTANDNFLVELMSLQINSYNSTGTSGSRKNIIAVIPTNNSITNSIVEYEPNNLYFVDIAEETTLRNLSARILKIDGSRPLLNGLSVLVFLIK